jgi:hypothetical protein
MLIKHLLDIHPLLERLQGLIVTLFPQVALPGLTRVSLGIENGVEDIDTLIHVLGKIARQSRVGMDRAFTSTQTGIQRQMEAFSQAAPQRVYTQLK